jgi:Ser-tRNA(Ala) deacylase AlaX
VTELLYLTDMHRLTDLATVADVRAEGEQAAVILDRTLFYPQGGGQPYDTGLISSERGSFRVEQTRFRDGEVLHIGRFGSGGFSAGETVQLSVDPERRALNSRLHSAGHIVDMAVQSLGLGWIPGKGYHFPDGPYVEYAGASDGDREALAAAIAAKCNEITRSAIETRVTVVPREELAALCRFVPDYVPEDKPSRVVMYGDFGVPCGGTHVARLDQVGLISIRKIKPSKESIRVSYGID